MPSARARHTAAAAAAALLLSAAGACADPATGPATATLAPDRASADAAPTRTATAPRTVREQQVFDLLRSIETGDPKPAAVVNPNTFIQHNLDEADGLAGFGAFLQSLPPGTARARPVRVFEDGDYVVAHTEYNLFGPKVGFDVLRYEHGLVVEHWDNLQTTAGPNPSGHTMLDGPAEPTDLDRTAANKALARAAVAALAAEGSAPRGRSGCARFFAPGRYVDHDPEGGDGARGLEAFAGRFAARHYVRTHAVFGKGSLVLVVGEGAPGGRPTAYYDLYRVAHAKLVEHWDVAQVIPPRDQWKNANGKFGF